MSALFVGLFVVPHADGSPITATYTATWTAAANAGDPPAPSPFYDCPGWAGGGLICQWIWDQGLEVSSLTALPMYGDDGPFYDALGTPLPVGPGGGYVLGIRVNCRPGLEPCINTFTPRSIDVDLENQRGAVRISFLSSQGGLVTAGPGLVNFVGAEWTDITSIWIGLFRPDECGDPDTELDCTRDGELGLYVRSLTFDATAVPEPASVLLMCTGLLAVLRRYRRA